MSRTVDIRKKLAASIETLRKLQEKSPIDLAEAIGTAVTAACFEYRAAANREAAEILADAIVVTGYRVEDLFDFLTVAIREELARRYTAEEAKGGEETGA